MAEGVGPDLDEALQGVVGHEILALQDLHGGRTSVVAVVEPPLDTGAIIGDAGAETDGGLHDVQRDGTSEKAGNRDKQVIPHHLQLSEKHRRIVQKEQWEEGRKQANRRKRAERGEDLRRERRGESKV